MELLEETALQTAPPPPTMAQMRGRYLCDLATWAGEARLFSLGPQRTTQEHQVHCEAREGEQASSPGDQGQQQVDYKCLL